MVAKRNPNQEHTLKIPCSYQFSKSLRKDSVNDMFTLPERRKNINFRQDIFNKS